MATLICLHISLHPIQDHTIYILKEHFLNEKGSLLMFQSLFVNEFFQGIRGIVEHKYSYIYILIL